MYIHIQIKYITNTGILQESINIKVIYKVTLKYETKHICMYVDTYIHLINLPQIPLLPTLRAVRAIKYKMFL